MLYSSRGFYSKSADLVKSIMTLSYHTIIFSSSPVEIASNKMSLINQSIFIPDLYRYIFFLCICCYPIFTESVVKNTHLTRGTYVIFNLRKVHAFRIILHCFIHCPFKDESPSARNLFVLRPVNLVMGKKLNTHVKSRCH